MFTRLPAAVRNLIVAFVLIVVSLAVKSHFDSDRHDLPPYEETSPPAVRVARETKPTIVESNENWLDSTEPDSAPVAPSLDQPRIELPALDR